VAGSLLGVDFGTSNTAAVLHRNGQAVPLLFDGSPLLPSAICLGPDGALLVGRDAERMAGVAPERFEPNPKRRIDDGTIWLGERELPVDEAIGAVLRRVADEATRVAGAPAERTVLTHPAAWAGPRMAVLASATRRAGLAAVRFVPEPVAAAAYFTTVLGRQLPPGQCVVVYDFGGGTFDVAVVAHTGAGFDVLSADGLPDAGGLDLDAAIVSHLRANTAQASQAWGQLDWPQSTSDRRAHRLLWQDARAVKEQLSRHTTASLFIPLADLDCHVTRDEFEKLAHPLLERTVQITVGALRSAGVGREAVRGLFLVGGSSRVPLAASLLHRALGIAPTTLEQPELVVASGAPHAPLPAPVRAVASVRPIQTEPPVRIEPPIRIEPPARIEPARVEPPPAAVAAPEASTSRFLPVIGLVALVAGVLAGIARMVLVVGDATRLRVVLGQAPAAIVNIAVGVAVWRLMRAGGTRAWVGAGILISYAAYGVVFLPTQAAASVRRIGHGAIDYRDAVLIKSAIFGVLAVFAIVALNRLRQPPRWPRPPRSAWSAVLITGALASAAGYFAINPPTEVFRVSGLPLLLLPVMAAVVPPYVMMVRTTALGVGVLMTVLASGVAYAVPLLIYWPSQPHLDRLGGVLFSVGTALVTAVVVRDLPSTWRAEGERTPDDQIAYG
jgi:hypothetical protein